MITLTNPVAVTTTLGASTKTNYDRLDLTSISMDVLNKNITGQCQLVASGTPGAAVIQGSYSIPTTGGAIMTVTIPSLPFYAQIALTSGQQAVVQGWISSTQNTVEAGIVSVAVVAGTQSSGT